MDGELSDSWASFPAWDWSAKDVVGLLLLSRIWSTEAPTAASNMMRGSRARMRDVVVFPAGAPAEEDIAFLLTRCFLFKFFKVASNPLIN